MGYTTDFHGSIVISPFCPQHLVKKINEFCEERHGGNINPFPGMPGLWCDYVVTEDGTKIMWNGSEKSYDMLEWLDFLIKKFFAEAGCILNGELFASGEEPGDVWKLCVKNNVVSRRNMPRDW